MLPQFARQLKTTSRGPRRCAVAFLAFTAVLAAACGVPISAQELALTPEPTPLGLDLAPAGLRVFVSTPVASASPGTPAAGLGTPSTGTTPVATAPVTTTASAGATGTPGTAMAATGTAAASPVGTVSATPTPIPPTSDLPGDAVRALNKVRTDSGRTALRVEPALSAAAAAYARLMADKNWFLCACDYHTGADGSQPEGRIAAAGYKGRFKGEALAAGQPSGDSAITTWLNSPAHAAIVLEPSAVEIGIGYAFNPNDPYKHYWVLVTGIP